MSKIEQYRKTLRSLPDWDSYLLKESGLPGPRGNLELAQAVAEEGNERLFRRYRSYQADRAPTNSPQEFLAFCGVLGLGKSIVAGRREAVEELRRHASDTRWRIREAVAMALQFWGDTDIEALLREMSRWADMDCLDQRAAVAALCEPRLLRRAEIARRALEILDAITTKLVQAEDRQTDAFKALRKALGYGWSVAVAALPEAGKPMMERWFRDKDKDIRFVMKENLKKNRLIKMDAKWVKTWVKRMET